MNLLFDDDLVEAAVLRVAATADPAVPALQRARFYAERERCYHVLDPDARNAVFARVHLDWFREWGLAARLEAGAAPFPHLTQTLAALAFRKARHRGDEGAELYGDAEGQRRGVVALRPERVVEPAALAPFLHHELAHLADMLDPAFGYSPDLGGAAVSPAQLRLVTERYRLLWAVSIDGRLIRRGLAAPADEAQRRAEFDRAFGFLPAARRTELFADLWSGRIARHAALLEVATDPRGLHDRHAPVPGAPCPLCGFAAFAWMTADHLSAAARARIHAEFPGWTESEALCARCAEVYEAVTRQNYPATVCL